MLFATASLVVVVFAHVGLIEPLLLRQKTLIDRSTRDQSQLAAVRAQIEGLLKEEQGDTKDPQQVAVRELEARLADLERALPPRKGSIRRARTSPARAAEEPARARGGRSSWNRCAPCPRYRSRAAPSSTAMASN